MYGVILEPSLSAASMHHLLANESRALYRAHQVLADGERRLFLGGSCECTEWYARTCIHTGTPPALSLIRRWCTNSTSLLLATQHTYQMARKYVVTYGRKEQSIYAPIN